MTQHPGRPGGPDRSEIGSATGGPPPRSDPTFADIVNGFTLDRGRRRNRHNRSRDTAQAAPERPVPEPPEPEPDPAPVRIVAAREPDRFEWAGPIGGERPLLPADDLGDEAAMVRPYAWTRGRTRSNVDLKLETLVSTSEQGQDEARLGQVEYRAVGALCRHPHSVAEVAAKLSIPLGVARVILSDMAEQGLISIHRTFADDDIAAHLVLMERVLSGLRRL